jgi:aminopeptidase N
VPLRVRAASGASRALSVRVRDRDTVIDLAGATGSADWQQVELDPELRLWRRLDPGSVPPIFREVFVSPRSQLFLANKTPQWSAPATALAGRLLETQAQDIAESELMASPAPVLVVGDAPGITRLLPALGIAGLPDVLLQPNPAANDNRPLKGSAQAWTARAANGKTFAFVMADNPQALAMLQRSLPHYGRQSWLVFRDGRVIEQGSWPVPAQSLPLASAAVR